MIYVRRISLRYTASEHQPRGTKAMNVINGRKILRGMTSASARPVSASARMVGAAVVIGIIWADHTGEAYAVDDPPTAVASDTAEAARYILARINSGAAIEEDWSWSSMPAVVARENDRVMELCEWTHAQPELDLRCLGALGQA